MINELLHSINQLLAADGTDDAEKRRVLATSPDPALQALSGQLSTRDVLIVATVAAAAPYPQKALPAQVNTSQPTASRAVERLIKLGLLTRTRIPNNQKEWQLALTPLGAQVAAAKQALDRDLRRQADEIASHYTAAELARFNQFLQEILALRSGE